MIGVLIIIEISTVSACGQNLIEGATFLELVDDEDLAKGMSAYDSIFSSLL